jgi:hypothetical protein
MGDFHCVEVHILKSCDTRQSKNGMMWQNMFHVIRHISATNVCQLVQCSSFVRVDKFSMIEALVASIHWFFDNVLDGLVHPFFLPQITIPSPPLGLTVDVQVF